MSIRVCEKVFRPRKDVPLKVEDLSGGTGPIRYKRAVHTARALGPQNLLRGMDNNPLGNALHALTIQAAQPELERK
jgi:hypothetical protein